MQPWVVDIANFITVVYPLTVTTLTAYYAEADGSYVQVSGSFINTGDGRYYIAHTFTSAGSYTIMIVDTANPGNTVYSFISVVTLADTIGNLKNFDPAADTVENVTLVATTTTNTDMPVVASSVEIALAVQSILVDEFAALNINIDANDVTTIAAAIKAKTDQLVFTKVGEIDANVKSENNATKYGSGVTADKWRGSP